MSRAFAITTPSPRVSMDASGRGEVSFTVSNVTALPLRAQAFVKPSPNLPPAWVSLRGAPVRELPPGSTSVFIVDVQVPSGTAPGAYTFHMVVADEALPDERYEEGPIVSLEVTGGPPAPASVSPRRRRLLGWLVLAAAVAVVLLLLLLRKREPPPIQCPGTTSLCSGQCVALLTDDKNCGACGVQCRAESVCEKGACRCKSYREAILADGPVGYWRLDDPPGATVTDSSANQVAGSASTWSGTGASGLVTEPGNRAWRFGSGGISLPTRLLAFQGSEGLTVEAWVSTTNATASQAVFSQQTCSQQTLQLWVSGGASFRLVGYRNDGTAIPDQSVGSKSKVADGRPHHLVGVRDLAKRTISIYVDGKLENSVPDETQTHGSLVGNIETWIGKRYPCRETNDFMGVMDEVAVYDKALTEEQIAAHYRLGTCREGS